MLATQYGPDFGQNDAATRIAVAKAHTTPPAGNLHPRVFVGGFAVHPGSSADMVTIRYIQE